MAVNEEESSQMEHEVITIDDEDEDAEMKKEEGNTFYKLKQYPEALACYTEAINIEPNTASYYGNRCACYVMLGNFVDALDDAKKSVVLDPTFMKGYMRMIKCYIALGDLKSAENTIMKAYEIDKNCESIIAEDKNLKIILQFKNEADIAYEKKDFRKVVYCVDRIIAQGCKPSNFKLLKAECLTYLGRYQEAQEIANDVIRADSQNVEAIYVRGMCLYYEDDIERAFSHFQHALKLAPDHKNVMAIYKKAKLLKQKKEEGNEAFKSCQYLPAYNLYSEALTIDPKNKSTNAKLYFNRATVSSKLGRLNEAVSDCTSALNLDSNYLKALLRRAKCYQDLSQHEDAVKDYEEVCRQDKSREYKRLLQEAKFELKKSKRKDYYKILGVDKNATTDDIKKAYRKQALVHHPDRHANASDGEKREQEKKFKEVGEAYGILSDPKKKTRYDSGQDMEDMDGMADIDPSRVFQTFFGPPQGGNFSFQSGFNTSGFTFQFG